MHRARRNSLLPTGLRLAVLILLPLLAGCPWNRGPEPASRVHDEQAPAPPAELSDAMWTLRNRVQDLEIALRPHGILTRRPPSVADVAPILEDMRAAIRPLLDAPEHFDREVLEHQLPRFDEMLEAARVSLDADPPEFQASERVTQACLACHDQGP